MRETEEAPYREIEANCRCVAAARQASEMIGSVGARGFELEARLADVSEASAANSPHHAW
jgi:hypothetical protein